MGYPICNYGLEWGYCAS